MWCCKHTAVEMSPEEFHRGRRKTYATERSKVDLRSSALDGPKGTKAPEEDVTVGTRAAFGYSAKATDSVPTAAELHRRHRTCATIRSPEPEASREEAGGARPSSPVAASGSALAVFTPFDCTGQGYLQVG